MTVTLISAPQLLGGVLPWSTAAIGALSVATLFAVWWALRERRQQVRAPTVLGFMMAALLWTGVQALPLPCALVGAVAPESVEQVRLTRNALAATDQGKRAGAAIACTISRDRGATELELVEGIAILAIFSACWLLCAAGRQEHVLRSVVASVLLIAFVSLLHRLAGAEKVFGLYEPRYAPLPAIGPLMNSNQLGGFIAMGFPAAVALGMRAERAERLLWTALALFIAGSVFLAMSRGGIGALLAGGALFSLLAASSRVRRQRLAGTLLVAAVAVAAGVGVGAYTALGALVPDAHTPGFSRLWLVEKALRYAAEQPWVGIGRGGFSAAFVQYEGTEMRFTHAENLPAEWIAEWGLPVGGALLLALALAVARGLYGARSILRIGALSGITAITAQNLADFSLELSGVATVASALLAVALHCTSPSLREGSQGKTKAPDLVRISPIGITAGALLLLVLAPRVLVLNTLAVQDGLQAAFEARDRNKFRRQLEIGLRMHPSEPNLTLIAAAEALRDDDAAAYRWLNRTMQLAPRWHQPHLLAARRLLRKGRLLQALLEVRESELRRPGSARQPLCRVLAVKPDIDMLLRVAPPGEQRIAFLERAVSCLDPRSPFAERIDAAMLELDPHLSNPRLRRAGRLRHRGYWERAIAELRSLVDQAPSEPGNHLALGRTLLDAGRSEEALETVKRAEAAFPQNWELIVLRGRTQAALEKPDAMRESVAELRGLAAGDAERLKRAMWLLAELEQNLGNRARAIEALQEAYAFSPESSTLGRIAALAEQTGARRKAASIYAKLCEMEPEKQGWCAARDRLLGRGRLSAEP